MTDTTIILTTHDRPQWFEQARASAVAQGCRLIVVDDASEPEYANADIRFPARVGFARARVAAVAHVDTPFVAFLDDDDVLCDDWLARSLEVMAEGYDVVAASYVDTDAELRRLRTHSLPVPTMRDLMAGYNPVNDFALIRRSVLEGVTWHPERESALMFSLWLDLLAKGARFAVVPDRWLWQRRLHGRNMSISLGAKDAAWRAEAIAEHSPIVPDWIEAFG